MNPTVSFVIPVFNQERYVAEAVNSALGQTFTDLEVIVVDDGSHDGSAAIVEAIADPRLRLVRRQNGGPSVATNDGIGMARGRYIALLGGDDVAEPERIASQVDVLEAGDFDLVFSLPAMIDADGLALSDEVFPIFRSHPGMTSAEVFRRLWIDGNFLCAPTCLMTRELTERVGLFRPELLQLQDYEYWLRIAGASGRFSVMEKRTTRYRRHSGNLSVEARDDATAAEFVFSRLRALQEAPGELLARAFPEMVPLGRSSASGIDRAMIALTHPLSASFGAALILDSFLSQEERDQMPDSRFGALVRAALEGEQFKLGPVIQNRGAARLNGSHVRQPGLN